MTKKLSTGGRVVAVLCSTCLLLAFGTLTHGQSGFGQAHALLAELDQMQKSGQHDKATVDKLSELAVRVQKETPGLINQGILGLLNSPGTHSPNQVRLKISKALQIVPADQYAPEVFVSRLTGVPEGYLIAYNVPYCASCSRAWIGVIGKKGGGYKILSKDDSTFNDKSLHVVALGTGETGRERFLVYGTNWGDAHSRLTATAYELIDATLVKFWSRVDLPQGVLKTSLSEISLTFLTALTPPWSERKEVYDVLPDRIHLRTSSERAAVAGPVLGQKLPTKLPFALDLISGTKASLSSGVWVKVRWTNTSEKALDSSANILDATNVDPNFLFDLSDKNGRPVPRKVYKFPETSGHAEFGTLAPGSSIEHDINLMRLFELKQPGKYLIQVSRAVPKELGGGIVKSSSITITITE